MTILHDPTSLEMLGPFNEWCGPISILIAFLPAFVYSTNYSLSHSLMTSSFSSTLLVPLFLFFYYLSVFWLSHFPLMGDNEIYQYPIDIEGFSLFASLPFLALFFFYFFLYKNNTDIQTLMHSCPVSLVHAQQLYRLGGACFAYIYYTQPNYNSFFNLQTGFLDIFMGLTAIPMGFYTHSNQKDLSSVKNLVLLWHFVGLYDLLSAFGMAGGCYFGFVSFGHSLGYLCFHPITLICYFQVAWAIGIHTMYLIKFDAIAEAQKKRGTQNQLKQD